MNSQDTVEIPRFCVLCQSHHTMLDLKYGHLCRFSTGNPPPRSAVTYVAWGYVGGWIAAIAGILALSILGSL